MRSLRRWCTICPFSEVSPHGNHYTFIGQSYVHGLMEGQAIDAWREGQLKDEIFGLR